jgi:hypothetical protein
MVCRGVGWFEGNWMGVLLFGGMVIAGGEVAIRILLRGKARF